MNDQVKIGAILLAAGAATRLHRRPKSLLELNGVALIRRQIMAYEAARIASIIVVLGHYADHIEPHCQSLSGLPITSVRNPYPDDGLASSLRVGLASLPNDLAAFVVGLADQPLIDAQAVRDLIHAYYTRPNHAQAVVPMMGEQRGNPVIFSAQVKAEILAENNQFGGREWQNAHPNLVHFYQTQNDHYCRDIDTEADIVQFAEDTGYRLAWPKALTSPR
ncbi:MAG: nucleotidyltransferase family protein [Alphaproteobacteria bacterium]|nr:nucleotidyltransferase family protein [Alphaproteobacteria bacterium]